jgi:hypothetical protein
MTKFLIILACFSSTYVCAQLPADAVKPKELQENNNQILDQKRY